MKIVKFIAAAALVALTGTAQAATYISTHNVGAGTANISITTDNTIGVLTGANITAFSITVTDPSGTFTLNRGNSGLGISGTNFTATATDLLYNFSANGYALFQKGSTGSSQAFYCLQGASGSCFDSIGPAEGLDSQNCCGSVERTARTGSYVVASVSAPGAVPEPATWAMMIGGFGAVGVAMRYRRRKVTVSFA